MAVQLLLEDYIVQATAFVLILFTFIFGTFLIVGLSSAGMRCILTILFLVLTSPTAAHALARASYKSGVKLWEKTVCDQYKNN